MAVRVTGWVPPLVTVDVRVAVGPSATFCAANVSATGVRESSVWVPVPVSAMVTSAALEATVIAAVFAPVDAGSTRARSVQVCPAVSAPRPRSRRGRR